MRKALIKMIYLAYYKSILSLNSAVFSQYTAITNYFDRFLLMRQGKLQSLSLNSK